MKKLLLLIFSLPIISNAQSVVRDLQYFPEEGSIWGRTSYSTEEEESISGTTDITAEASSLSQDLYYIFQRGHAVGISFSYIPETKLDVGSDSYKSDGLANPVFQFTKRMKYQDEYGYNLDLTAVYSPDLLEAKDSSTTKDGTVASGRNVFAFSAELGKKEGMRQYSLFAAFTYNGEKEEEPSSGSGKNTAESSTVLRFGGIYQWDINYNFSIRGSLTYIRYGDSESEDDSSNKTKVDSYSYLDFGLQGIYAVNNDLMLTAGFTQSSSYEIEGTYNTSDILYEDVSDFSTTISAVYKF